MDVVCVRSQSGDLFATDFYVKLKVPTYGVEQASAVFLGITEDTATEGERSLSASDIFKEEESSLAEDLLHIPRKLLQRLQPFLVDLLNNRIICEGIIAYIGDKQMLCFYDHETKHHYTTPPSRILQKMHLVEGKNIITCIHRHSNADVAFNIWCYPPDAKLIILDIDGTITKSNVTGYISTVYFGIYSYVHKGLVEFLHQLHEIFGYQCIYLTARPYSHRKQTRLLLEMIRGTTSKDLDLPDGPLFTTAGNAITALYQELIIRNSARNKSDILCSIWDCFKYAGCQALSPFKLGVGNEEHDAMAYNSVGVPGEAVFLINAASKISVWKYSRPAMFSRATSASSTASHVASSSSTTAAAATTTQSTTAVGKVENDGVAMEQEIAPESVNDPSHIDDEDLITLLQQCDIPGSGNPHASSSKTSNDPTNNVFSRPVLLRSQSERPPPSSSSKAPSKLAAKPSVTVTTTDSTTNQNHPNQQERHSAEGASPIASSLARAMHATSSSAQANKTKYAADDVITRQLQLYSGHLPDDAHHSLQQHPTIHRSGNSSPSGGIFYFDSYSDPRLLQYICELEVALTASTMDF